MNQSSNIISKLRFINYVVNKVEFYMNPEFEGDCATLDFKVDKEIAFLEDAENTTLVTLKADIFPNASKQNYPFSMKLEITGFFEIENGTSDYEARILAEKNAISILFPYLRAMVTTYSCNANVEPIIIPPINIHKLVENN
ncbi:protein-export chaperone SecB [Niameybacter massiliensis]|uniref:Protein-export chaperone SecB n=1 Tax=Holtiella tumoricola TaxID=3018743 RepID=A0AA42DQ79_9FIRM|nr:protein-export chaperone SecB [Holtiella tumoricola]MDA3732881.1 protein-export chaperone SecB [Holtiella tumoricola]